MLELQFKKDLRDEKKNKKSFAIKDEKCDLRMTRGD